MTEPLQYQKFLLLGRVCEIQAVADKKRPGRRSKAQIAAEEAERLIAEVADADGVEEAGRPEGSQAGRKGKPVTDGHEFIKKKLLEHLDTIAVGIFQEPKKMKPATLKLLWDLGKMNEKTEPRSRGGELTLSKLLLNELKQMNKPADGAHEQA